MGVGVGGWGGGGLGGWVCDRFPEVLVWGSMCTTTRWWLGMPCPPPCPPTHPPTHPPTQPSMQLSWWVAHTPKVHSHVVAILSLTHSLSLAHSPPVPSPVCLCVPSFSHTHSLSLWLAHSPLCPPCVFVLVRSRVYSAAAAAGPPVLGRPRSHLADPRHRPRLGPTPHPRGVCWGEHLRQGPPAGGACPHGCLFQRPGCRWWARSGVHLLLPHRRRPRACAVCGDVSLAG